MKLICINELEDFGRFESPLKELFMVIACRQDKNKLKKLISENKSYQNMDSETAEVMVGMKSRMVKQKEEGEGVNMCEALRGMLEDSRVEGREEGKAEGDILRLMVRCSESIVKERY